MLEVKQRLLTLNPWSHPGTPIGKIRGLVLHWTENAGKDALYNWRFFESRKAGNLGYGSAHFIVDLNGAVYCIIPTTEVAYHAGPTAATLPEARKLYGSYPNGHLIGIELTHPDWSGRPSDATWSAAVELCAILCAANGLPPEAITTHHAIVGKLCPKWFIDHPAELQRFREEVREA